MDTRATLAEVVSAAHDKLDVLEVQRRLADIVAGWRLRPTPALTAVAGAATRVVVTTNYDDAIELAARDRGLQTVSLLPKDPRILEQPEAGRLHVVHLHGFPAEPASLVLPGPTTNALVDEEPFATFVRATLARHTVVYLGFSLSPAELHLRATTAWLAKHVERPRRQYLLLGARAREARAEDVALLDTRVVSVVTYVEDPQHTAVERVSIAMAPRAFAADGDSDADPDALTYVSPILMRLGADDAKESVRGRLALFDVTGQWSEGFALPSDLLEEEGAMVIIAGPGMGKTRLLDWLASSPGARTRATARLRDFRPSPKGRPPEHAIRRLLRDHDGEPLAVEALEDAPITVLLDALDEVEADDRDDAVAALAAARAAWSQHRWIVSSRPSHHSDDLRAAGFGALAIVASRRWAERYLETRAVPRARIERALLDGYGLGDLCTVPLFAERLADRLLDEDDAKVTPLELLVEQQIEATGREARRHGIPKTSLSGWLRALAVGLELRARLDAPASELSAVSARLRLSPDTAHDRLVDGSLLRDDPTMAGFPRRTLQQALCAHAMLAAADVARVLRFAAIAEVAGTEHFRDDLDFTVDLVFEHADPIVRSAVRTLDEQCWARTVTTRGTEKDARDALAAIERWHADRELDYGAFAEGLRSPHEAVVAIVQRWPTLVRDRLAAYVDQSRSPSAAERARALTVLGALPPDERTDAWLLPRLADADERVAARAAAVAGQWHFAPAVDAVKELAGSSDERVRNTALAALVEMLPVERLPEIAEVVTGDHALRPIANRLLARLDLDTGIALAGRMRQMLEVTAWLVERLIESASHEAWTPERVAALMAACSRGSIGSAPDPLLLATIIGRHPEVAIAAVRVTNTSDGRPWAPPVQLLALNQLDPALLRGDAHGPLRAAIARALEEEEDFRRRCEGPARALAALAARLDKAGLDIEPDDVRDPIRLRDLDDRHKELLTILVERWWPESTVPLVEDDDTLTDSARAALRIGAELRPPLPRPRWLALLDAYLPARDWHQPELAADGVLDWLRRSAPDDADSLLLPRLASAPDGTAVAKLVALAGRKRASPSVRTAAFERLAELDPTGPGWLNAVGLLLEDGDIALARDLLERPMPESIRDSVLWHLARHGDADSQAQVAKRLESALRCGDHVNDEPPHWDRQASAPAVRGALVALAAAAIEHERPRHAGFAVEAISAAANEDALQSLTVLAEAHDTPPWLGARVERLARQIATRRVLDRLPERIDDVVMAFEAVAAPAADGD